MNPHAEREQARTLVYVGVTALLLLLTVIDPFSSSAKSPELESGGKFFPDLTSLDQARGLEVFEWDSSASAYNAFKVAFQDGVWTIPSKESYPADAENKIGKIASALMALEKTKLRTSREEDHSRLGVVDPKSQTASVDGVGTRLRLLGEGGEILADVIVGKKLDGEDGQRYIRRMTEEDKGESRVYAAAFAVELDTDFSSWIDTDLLHLDVAQISSLTVDRLKIEVGIDPATGQRFGQLVEGKKSLISQKDYTWSVEGMGSDHEANMPVIDKVTETLKELTIKNVLKRSEAALNDVGFFPLQEGYFSNEGQIRVDLKDGVTYILRFGNASAATGDPQRFLIVENELCKPIYQGLSAEGKQKAQQRVDELNARFSAWFYLISAKDFEALKPKHEDLSQKKAEGEPGEHGPGDGHGHEGEPATPDDESTPPFPTPPKVEGGTPGNVPGETPDEEGKKTSDAAPVKSQAESDRLYEAARKGWSGEPGQVVTLLEQSAAAAPRKPRRLRALLALGIFRQGKLGDFPNAIKDHQRVVAETVGEKSPALMQLKAQALKNLGIIYYTGQHDLDEAIVKLSDSIEVSATADAADVLSQVLFRVARDGKRSEKARKAQLESALKMARLAEKLSAENADKAKPEALAARSSKIKLQLAILFEALGRAAEAKQVFGEPEQKSLSDAGLYQQAILQAVRGADSSAVAAPLVEALGIRPSAAARNRLRWMIRTEPDLAKYRADPSWKELVTDEPVK
jgi:tetratricopeptide (TPR) repeat protein